MPEGNVLKLRLSLMGRPVRSYTFDKPVITVGRDPGSDVFVDNPGVSRDHFRLELTPAGQYQVVDLGSANGTFVNEQMINTATVRNNDVVRFGKYTMWIGYDVDRRDRTAEQHRKTTDTDSHTVVLSRSELGQLLEKQQEKDAAPPTSVMMAMPSVPGGPAAAAAAAAANAPPSPVAAVLTAFLLGTALGAGVTWLLLR